MSIPKFIFPHTQKNDTIHRTTFVVENKDGFVDLTGATITATFKLNSSTSVVKTIGNGITLDDATSGRFFLDAFSLSQVGTWYYDLQIVLADSTVMTAFHGTLYIEHAFFFHD